MSSAKVKRRRSEPVELRQRRVPVESRSAERSRRSLRVERLKDVRGRALASVPPLSDLEYRLASFPRDDDEERYASAIIWSRAAALRAEARRLLEGGVHDGR